MAARNKALLAWWGDKRVSDIRRSTCEAYVAHRCAQPIATAKGDKPRLVSAQDARREPEKPESPRDALTRSQAAALLWASMGWRKDKKGKWKRVQRSSRANRAHLRRFILIGLYTGTRPGVIPKLLWEESPAQAWVDLESGTIYRRGKLEREHRTKRRPLVRVPGRLLAHMRRWRELDRAVMLKKKKEELPTTNTVLHYGGQPIAGRIRRGFASCVADAGLDEETTPHWMRHTAATWLMASGVDPWESAGYLGMNLKTLLDNYGHHQPNHHAKARAGMGARRGA